MISIAARQMTCTYNLCAVNGAGMLTIAPVLEFFNNTVDFVHLL